MAKWNKINYDSSDLGPWMDTTSGVTTWTAGDVENSGDPIYVDSVTVNDNTVDATVNVSGYYGTGNATGTAEDYSKIWTNPYKQDCDDCKGLKEEVTKLRTILRELLIDVKEGEAEIDRERLLDALLAVLG